MRKQRLTEIQRRAAFFYAEADADLYDASVELNTPQYELVNKTLLELLDSHFGVLGTRKHKSIKGHFLDIGSGTGAQTVAVLERFPRLAAVALDLCAPMHDLLKAKVIKTLGNAAFDQRCRLVVGDFVSPAGTPHNLLKELQRAGGEGYYRFVITAFALHHLTDSEKQEAYRRIYNVLEPGGLLLNADLFSFQSPELKQQAHEFIIRYINKQHTKPDPEFREAYLATGERREHLRKAWIRHCNENNLPAPVESPRDSILGCRGEDGATGQAGMLLKAGFREVGCPLRFWQIGILWGKK
jgi:tRNA (cmo5U34)-methyltransferase